MTASAAYQTGDDDTILVEKQPSQKIPYHKILKSITKQLFKFDSESVFSFGKGKSTRVVRSFGDLVDRSKTRFNIKRDKIEVKFSLNF